MLALWWPTNADTYPLTLIKQRKIYAMNTKSRINWKLFRLLFGAGVFGSLAALPYTLTILGDQISESAKSLSGLGMTRFFEGEIDIPSGKRPDEKDTDFSYETRIQLVRHGPLP